MTDIRPHKIDIPESELEDLRNRLKLTRFPEKETPEDWSQGIPLAYVKEVAGYWLDHYDWRGCEGTINKYDGFLTEIDGVDIFFLHIKSKEEGARALLLTHGWPGSILEFFKCIGPLTDPLAHGGKASDAFHLVIPCLPGYGFSGKPEKTGWKIEKIADAWAELMKRLDYNEYFAQGGDWGSAVTSAIGLRDTEHCKAIHVNMVVAAPDPDTMNDLSEQEQATLAAFEYYNTWDSGYSKQQSTRPQTLGYGLVDSPVGQMAWIIEKFWAWCDCGDDEKTKHPENALSKDEMLDNVMLYWLTASGASSARLYWESFNSFAAGNIKTPMGGSIFPKEILKTSRRWAATRYKNIIHWNELDKGGHFAAFEQPELFVKEIRDCFSKI